MIFSRSGQRGMSLMAIIVLVFLVGGISSAFMLMSLNESRTSEVMRGKMRATYLAEAALEEMAYIIRRIHADNRRLDTEIFPGSNPSITVNGRTIYMFGLVRDPIDTVPPIDPDLNPDDDFDTFRTEMDIHGERIAVEAVRYMEHPPISDPANPDYEQTKDNTTRFFYNIRAEILTGQGKKGLMARDRFFSRVERVLMYEVTPIFDSFAFWNGDLEILPGPKAIFNGRVHTNGNLYIGSGGGLDINTDYFRAVGEMYRHRKNNGSVDGGHVRLHDRHPSPYEAQNQISPTGRWDWQSGYESDGQYNSTWDKDKNWISVIDGAGAGKIRNNDTDDPSKLKREPPDIGVIAPGGKYHNDADILIQDDKVFIPAGTGADGSTVWKEIDPPDDAIRTSQIYDAREAESGIPTDTSARRNVPVTIVDIGKMGSALPSKGKNGDGLVVYAYRTGTGIPEGGKARLEGIVLTNGKQLPQNMTFVTNGSVYVHGDFNNDIKNADGKITAPRKGAAVIGDAVNLLSNKWDLNNSSYKRSGSGVPSASETTYNFALVTGNTPTDTKLFESNPNNSMRYSGGLENLPRFHENWGGVKCNYQGSLICLWESAYATGRWGKSGVYSPPNRQWDFDARFGDPASSAKPPMFPTAIGIARTTYREGVRVSDAVRKGDVR